jgi:hypothetical protein
VENPKPAEEPAAPAPGPVENPPSIAEIKEKGKELKAQVKKTLKGIKLYIVTFIKDEKQHIWAVKAASEDTAKSIANTVSKQSGDIKAMAAYTLDHWVEHVWREWPMRRKIARGLSKASKEMNWNSLSARAKAIALRNFLMMRIHNWASNPPETWDDVDDEIAGADEVDDGYEPEAPIQNPPYNQLPGKRYNIPTGYYITKENPPAENNDVPACKHCGGQIINTGKYAHNPRGAKVFWLLECQDCKAKYKLTDS